MAIAPYVINVSGGPKRGDFETQFHDSYDARTFAVTPIEYFDVNGNILNQFHATGFLYRHGGELFLVTAGHALSGRDAFTGEFSVGNTKNFEPERIRIRAFAETSPNQFQRRVLELDISRGGPFRWLIDPLYEKLNTDIAVVRLRGFTPTSASVDLADDENLVSFPGGDCVAIGYPGRNYGDPYPGVWRRASFASDPSISIDGRPLFLVDGLTSPGMSGSPIFQRTYGPFTIRQDDGELNTNLGGVVATKFIGVYGGRLSSAHPLGSIGYGWYANRIPKIIEAGIIAP